MASAKHATHLFINADPGVIKNYQQNKSLSVIFRIHIHGQALKRYQSNKKITSACLQITFL